MPRVFADPVSPGYGQDIAKGVLKVDRSGNQKQVPGIRVGSLFASCEKATESIRLFSGFGLGQDEASGEVESVLYLLPAGQGEKREDCNIGTGRTLVARRAFRK